MRLPSGPPPSRLGKRQVGVYLAPDMADRVRGAAHASRESIQTLLARAINAELASRGLPPPLSVVGLRQFKRVVGAATSRVAAPDCRRGTKIVAGWYDRKEVERLVSLCSELGTTVQAVATAGLEKLNSLPSDRAEAAQAASPAEA